MLNPSISPSSNRWPHLWPLSPEPLQHEGSGAWRRRAQLTQGRRETAISNKGRVVSSHVPLRHIGLDSQVCQLSRPTTLSNALFSLSSVILYCGTFIYLLLRSVSHILDRLPSSSSSQACQQFPPTIHYFSLLLSVVLYCALCIIYLLCILGVYFESFYFYLFSSSSFPTVQTPRYFFLFILSSVRFHCVVLVYCYFRLFILFIFFYGLGLVRSTDCSLRFRTCYSFKSACLP